MSQALRDDAIGVPERSLIGIDGHAKLQCTASSDSRRCLFRLVSLFLERDAKKSRFRRLFPTTIVGDNGPAR